MKKLNLILATLGLVFIFAACEPSSEDVQPQTDPQKLEKFEVKSTEDPSIPPRRK